MTQKIDITSSVVEKGIDLVKDFVEKLAGSTLEETGLLFGDKIRLFRLKNQIKILSKAQEICKENNIPLKQLSVKTLVPLLEYSSLEDNETLQEKWSNLLVNLIEESEKYESTIFPFILNQLSSKEIKAIERLYEVRHSSFMNQMISESNKANLIRLGLIENIYKNPLKKEIRISLISNRELKSFDFRLTELGIDFIKCCATKTKKDN